MPARPNILLAYAAAVAACIVTVALHVAFVGPTDEPIAIVFVLPILIGAAVGGLGPGLLATALAEVALVLLDSGTENGVDVFRAVFLAIAGASIAATTEALHHARRDAAEGRNRFEAVFRAMPAAMTIARPKDAAYAWLDVNDAFEELSGWHRADVLGRSAVDIGLLPNADLMRARVTAVMQGGHVRDSECEVRTKSGQRRTVLVSSEGATLDGETVLLTMGVDVTARVEAERKLRESEERFRQLAEGIHEVFFLVSADLRELLYVSPQYERIFGKADVALSPFDFLTSVVDEDRARVVSAMLDVGQAHDFEYRIKRAPLGEVRYVRTSASPVRDADGNVTRIAGFVEDITEAKKLEQELHQTQKLESIGRLAGGVAHDFNNLLTIINASLSCLTELDLSEEAREVLGDIAQASDRAKSLTKQLLAFSRKQIVDRQNVDVNALVKDASKMVGRLLGEDIEVKLELASEPAWILIDPGQFVQVLMNLSVNARDAMQDGGVLTVATVIEEGRVVIAVRDTGCGMTDAVKARVFEPFFTTKKVGVGTGLGLAVTHGIVAQSGGTIGVVSEVGKGTTFRLSFPRTGPEAPAAKSPADARGGTETVMLVEDDAGVRKIAARALAVCGFHVVEAPDAATALSYLENDRNNVDLLVTDVVMPGISGRELAERASAFLPKLPVLYVSGYTDDEVVRRGVEHGKVDLLSKPYSPVELVARVRQALDHPKPLAAPVLVA